MNVWKSLHIEMYGKKVLLSIQQQPDLQSMYDWPAHKVSLDQFLAQQTDP